MPADKERTALQDLHDQLEGKVAIVAMNPGIIDTDMLRSTFGPHAGQYPNSRRGQASREVNAHAADEGGVVG